MSCLINASTSAGLVNTADTSGNIEIQNNGTTAMTVTGGNVGIGTTSPTGKLQVTGAGGVSGSSNLVYVDVSSSYGGISVNSTANNNCFVELLEAGTKVGGFNADTTANVTSIQSAGGHVLAFNVANTTEVGRFDTSGNLLVGQTALSGAEKVGMTQSANGQVIYALASDSSTYTSSVALLRGARNTTNGTWSFLRCFNNGDKLYVYDSGNVVNANNSYGAISDIKLKENIVDATPKLEDLCKVKVRQYNLIGDDKKQIGVVAQELEKVFAGLVDESADKDQDGNDLGTSTKQVKYSVFVPMLIKAVQELKAELDATKAEVAALKGKA